MTLRRAAVAVSATALAMAVGCGPSEDTSAGQPTSEKSVASGPAEPAESTRPASAPPSEARVDPDAELTLASFSTTTSQAQVRAQTARIRAEIEMQGERAVLTGDMSIGESLAETSFEIEMSAPSVGDDVSLVLVDNTLYQKTGDRAGGRYLALDLADRSNPLGAFYTQLLGQADPAGIVRAFEDAIHDFCPVGTARLDGVSTTRYRVTADTRKVLGRLLGADLMATLSGLGPLPQTLTYDVWIGDDNLPRRMTYAVMGNTVVIDLTDWGEPVDIQAPPPSQVSDKPLVIVPTVPDP
jgi:hypothetical protein